MRCWAISSRETSVQVIEALGPPADRAGMCADIRERTWTDAEKEAPPEKCAFFLDVEGTLMDFAAGSVDPSLSKLLRLLALRSGGAVALISGRSITWLDVLFAPLCLPSAGLHGFERRNGGFAYTRCTLPSGLALSSLRRWLAEITARDPRLVLEDKRFALALHYREAPHLEDVILRAFRAAAKATGNQLYGVTRPARDGTTPE